MAEDVRVIEPEEIPEHITGKVKVEGAVIVRCEDVDVCRYTDGQLEAVACDHPSHGCHPRFREAYARVHELLAGLRIGGQNKACPKCGGTGWLATNSAEARHVVLLSTMIGMWRGVSYKPRGLLAMKAGVTMEAILTGHKPADASSTPGQEGCSWPGTFLGAEGEGEGKGEGGTDV